jgi:hypothetical protein
MGEFIFKLSVHLLIIFAGALSIIKPKFMRKLHFINIKPWKATSIDIF